MTVERFEHVLVLSPHTDDGELGLGGTIARLVERGVEVYYHAFSNAAKSLPADLPADTLERELRNAMDVLQVPQERVHVLPHEVRTFSYHRQEILESLVKLKKDLHPDLVFLPSTQDVHQDHQVLNNEGVRAFKTTCLLGYELPWNNISFPTNCFTILEDKHVQKKVEALSCYKSQRHHPYLKPEFIRSLAVTRGTQIQVEYAEAFEVIRWVWP